MKKIKYAVIAFATSCFAFTLQAQMTPQEAIGKMMRGMNIGRSLELTTEGEAGNRFILESYFEDMQAAGFTFVRIPVQWDNHTALTSPYTVDSAWLTRVNQVVDWALEHKIMIMINSHHDRWILEDANYTADEQARFEAIWTQVSTYFKDKSDSLLFEIANEPNQLSITQVNELNASVISIIRSTNPTRIIVYSGNGYTSVAQMKSAAIPNDAYIMATFHSYDPWNFAGLGTGTWGTSSDIQAVKNRYSEASTWSKSKNIPVLLGEFGTVGKCDEDSRLKWFHNYVVEAIRYEVAFCAWHDFGDFGFYYPTNSASARWNDKIKDILIYSHPLSAASLTASAVLPSGGELKWTNYSTNYNWIKVERGTDGKKFATLATLDSSATSDVDATAALNTTYYYRVASELETGVVVKSFPLKTLLTAPAGIDENTLEVEAYVSDNKLTIKRTDVNATNALNIKMFTVSGQLVFSHNLELENGSFDISGLSQGIYLVSISDKGGRIQTVKVCK
jgi:aryl-phospho-beta-D-glucosidase BglC (GH1 family)